MDNQDLDTSNFEDLIRLSELMESQLVEFALDLDVEIDDINNDGLGDFGFQYATADLLREFASITLYEQRTVTVIDKNGVENIIDQSPYDMDDESIDIPYGGYDYYKLKN